MAVGSGLSGSFGIATESTPGTPAVVTRFAEFDSETLQMKKKTVQGVGLRGGALTKRGARRVVVSREVGGDVNFDLPTASAGLFLQHMFGSYSTVPTSLGGGLYQQVHNVGTLGGKAFTAQVVKPDITGVLTQNAYTYIGCKVAGWTVSAQAGQQVKVSLTLDGVDVATPSNNFVSTTLASASTAAATSFSSTATIAAGSYVLLGTGLQSEVVQTGTPTGTGPFVIPTTQPLAYAHASGATVSSATGVNYGSAVVLQAPTYNAAASLFAYDYQGSQLIAGGTTSSVSGVWTNTGGTAVGNVRSFSLKATHPFKSDRWGLGSAVKSEQLENDYRSYELACDVEYSSPYFYQNYTADVPLALQIKFANPTGGYLQFYIPVGFQNDGSDPQVGGPDILISKLTFEVLDDGVNGALQAVYVSTDAAV